MIRRSWGTPFGHPVAQTLRGLEYNLTCQMPLQTDVFELICVSWQMHIQPKHVLGFFFCSRCRDGCSLQLRGGSIADQNYFRHHCFLIADADTDAGKIVLNYLAMNLNKRYSMNVLVRFFLRSSQNHSSLLQCKRRKGRNLKLQRPKNATTLTIGNEDFFLLQHSRARKP